MAYLGSLYIISAPSGGGKTSLVKALLESTRNLVVSISYTTRAKRPGEQHGINYYFVTDQEFAQLLNQAEFLEHATVFGHHYGTSKQWVTEKLSAGIDVILEIDWQGAQQIRQLMPGVTIFILPPSREVLLKRLCSRAQDDEAIIKQRMAQATNEISHYAEYDYLVVNDDFSTALADLQAIIHAQRLLLKKQSKQQAELLANLLA